MRSTIFWEFTQCTVCQAVQGKFFFDCLTRESLTDRLSLNVGHKPRERKRIEIQNIFNNVYHQKLSVTPEELSQCTAVTTNHIHSAVFLSNTNHHIPCSYETKRFILFPKTKHLTLFRASWTQYTHRGSHISSFPIVPHLSFSIF
jgi:hypothetical protein